MLRAIATSCLVAAVMGVAAGCKAKTQAESEPISAVVHEGAPEEGGLAPLEPLPVEEQTYVVQNKDTLWSIAQRFYGDGKQWKKIAHANGIADETKLSVGTTLIIP